jgi:hypothetical protein
MGLVIDGAVQQAPHSGRQFTPLLWRILSVKQEMLRCNIECLDS